MMEVIIAVALFAMVGTAMVVAINDIADLTFKLHRQQRLSRIIDSELRRAMSMPNLEEGKETVTLDELGVELETLIEPIEEMENQDGQLLSNMFRIQVSAYWWADGEYQNERSETWRYARLYRQ
jgi:Na+-translocating ferredoxin:NAD+ oxidoreductase RnfG subunit